MNERIRELMLEAGYAAPELAGRAQRFADLLVRECVNEIHVADVGDLKAKGYYLDKVAEHVEKRFGI